MKWAVAAAFVGTVIAANWAIQHVGTEVTPDGTHLIPVWPGLLAPSGVLFAGVGFLLRDLLHEIGGRAWVVGAIVLGAFLSWFVSDGGTVPGGLVPIAVASGSAFLVSELCDFGVYAPLRDRSLSAAVGVSQIVGAAVDSALFLWLAFGSLAFFWGQFVGKTLLVLPVVVALGAWRWRAAVA